MTSVFEQIIERGHERICFHHDRKTGLRAIIAIHSTRLGNALGGTRRWYYPTEADALFDVLRLSEGMTFKAAAAGLPMGGAKSVVLLPESGFRSTEAEARAMGRFVDTFSGAYIAAEDVGVDTQYVDWMAMETKHVMGGLKVSHGGDPSPFTAQGVVNAMKAALIHRGRTADFKGVTVAIQGAGNVGRNVARILTAGGATVIMADINQANLDLAVKQSNVQVVPTDKILSTQCDILSPCALGGVITSVNARNLHCKFLIPGANNVLMDPDEDAATLRGMGITYVPDFVANAGGLIHLAGLYLGMTEPQLARKLAEIETTSLEILRDADANSSTTYAAAVRLVHKRLEEGPQKLKSADTVHSR
ncbi:MAG TPA: Glu/Leu/Phe/Val dehydrogenase dimerization domain-containing protein [Phycisphaerales bacterium]|nr:Glu/Leu/Phe/Val dehydrogenase dimerization domain-containing protein [Phycisphaerales bacterium]